MTSVCSPVSCGQASVFECKDPVSALTHFIGFLLAVFSTPALLIHASCAGASGWDLVSLSVFLSGMILLYGASASYHAFRLSGEKGLYLKRLDHMMIFVLIAGTYTPFCTIVLRDAGLPLLITIWCIAAAGLLFKFCWVTCPRWVSSLIYILMGWAVIFAFPVLLRELSPASFGLLLNGGILYTAGGIIYALKLVRFRRGESAWGSHEIFHLFVMAGSFSHFFSIWLLF